MKRYLLLLLCLTGLLLVACGGSTPPSPTGANLHSSPGQSQTPPGGLSNTLPTVLQVTRTDPSATNNIGPLDKTLTDPSRVQEIYASALKQVPYPTGSTISQSCLNDTGVIYHLDFRQDATELQHMNLDPGNCRILYLSQSDLRQASDAFLNLLKSALQVSSLTSN